MFDSKKKSKHEKGDPTGPDEKIDLTEQPGIPMNGPEGASIFAASSGQLYSQGNKGFFWVKFEDMEDAIRNGFTRVE